MSGRWIFFGYFYHKFVHFVDWINHCFISKLPSSLFGGLSDRGVVISKSMTSVGWHTSVLGNQHPWRHLLQYVKSLHVSCQFQFFSYISTWFQCGHGDNSLPYNHCMILFIQAYFHTEVLVGEFDASLSSATYKEVNKFWVTQIRQTKYQNIDPPMAHFHFHVFDHGFGFLIFVFWYGKKKWKNYFDCPFWSQPNNNKKQNFTEMVAAPILPW